jgi:hypothetical protein
VIVVIVAYLAITGTDVQRAPVLEPEQA